MTENTHVSALSGETLMSVAYDEGMLSEDEREHLKQCLLCQQQLTLYRKTNALLTTQLYRRQCPSSVELNYYCLGMVSDESRTRIASHILDCPNCTDEIVETRHSQANFEAFSDTPSSVQKAMRCLFATHVVQQAHAVLRNTDPEKRWPRQYHTELIDLWLDLSRTSKGEIMLLGIITASNTQVTIDAFEKSKVDFYSAPGPLFTESNGEQGNDEPIRPLLSTQIDKVGNILLEPVPAGEHVMVVRILGQEVVIKGLIIDYEY